MPESSADSLRLEPAQPHYTVHQISVWLGVHPNTVYRWIRRKELQAVTIGRRDYRVPRRNFLAFYQEKSTAKTAASAPPPNADTPSDPD